MQRCIKVRTAKTMSEIFNKKLASFVILWGSLASCAAMASALFESRKRPILGTGLFGNEVTHEGIVK